MLDAQKIIELLNLEAHPCEGGYFIQTYKCDEELPLEVLPGRYKSSHSISTAIYYLITPETFSTLHKLESDEIFHFYMGDPVEMLQLYPDGTGKMITIGQDILNGMELQVTVSKGVWQGSRLKPGGKFALLGTTVAPGFEYEDYTTGDRSELVERYPEFKEIIVKLTR